MFSSESGLCTLNNLTQLELLERNYRSIQMILSKNSLKSKKYCTKISQFVHSSVRSFGPHRISAFRLSVRLHVSSLSVGQNGRSSVFVTFYTDKCNKFSSFFSRLSDWPLCSYKKELPTCSGHRCALGECIADERVCDKKMDCRDGSDEHDELCRQKNKCSPHELRCGDGSCVLKTKFCDRVVDCADRSDEPDGCTCFQYLE